MTIDRRRKRRVRARAAKTGESYTAALRNLMRLEEATMPNLSITSAGVTDVGNTRATNQDTFLTTTALFAVADGFGDGERQPDLGHQASRLAIEAVQEAFADDPTGAGLVEAVRRANTALIDRIEPGADPSPPGTTIAAVARVGGPDDDRLVVVNVGDSRVYLLREGSLRRLSSDHSRVVDLVRAGEISERDAADHPERHVLTVALGVTDAVSPSINHVRPVAGDRVLLCSDGLFNDLPAAEILATLTSVRSAREAADRLVAQAKANGGSDNITAVVVELA